MHYRSDIAIIVTKLCYSSLVRLLLPGLQLDQHLKFYLLTKMLSQKVGFVLRVLIKPRHYFLHYIMISHAFIHTHIRYCVHIGLYLCHPSCAWQAFTNRRMVAHYGCSFHYPCETDLWQPKLFAFDTHFSPKSNHSHLPWLVPGKFLLAAWQSLLHPTTIKCDFPKITIVHYPKPQQTMVNLQLAS